MNPGVTHSMRLKLLRTDAGAFHVYWKDDLLWREGARWMKKERLDKDGKRIENAKSPWFIKMASGQRKAIEAALKAGNKLEEGSLLWNNGFRI